MDTQVHEIAAGIFRLSTLVPGPGGPAGMTYNQFLIVADEPMLFHCGQHALFPSVSQAASRVIALDRLRWISYSHAEADECGALNDWLAAAPNAVAAHGRMGCNLWLNDQAIRPPRMLADGEVMDLGGKRVRHIATPHVPHCWDAAVLFEETTGTLFTTDLLTQFGDAPPVTSHDVLDTAIAIEKRLKFTPITAQTAPTVRKLGLLEPTTLAIMHGSSYSGAGKPVLEGLAGFYEEQLKAEIPAA
jgi:flavorubredoxin